MTTAATDVDHPSPAWRDPALGPARLVELDHGTTRYFDTGPDDGRVVVFVQGWMVNANHWRKVVALLAPGLRCVTVDWPTGSHEIALRPGADLSPAGCARHIADLLAALDLREVTLVGNDSGGALSQIVTANHPERIGRVLLTACETPHDVWPPPEFAVLTAEARRDGLADLMAPLADPAFRREPVAYGLLAKHGIPDEVSDTYVEPFLTRPAIRRDTHAVMSQADVSYVQAAGRELARRPDLPVVLAWATEDPIFPLASAHRYAADLPNATVEPIDDAYSFTPEDQPTHLAHLIATLTTP